MVTHDATARGRLCVATARGDAEGAAMARSPRRSRRGSDASERGATEVSPSGRASTSASTGGETGTGGAAGDDDDGGRSSLGERRNGDVDGRARKTRDRAGGRVDGSDDPRLDVAEPGFHLSKAPPLTASMIEVLDAVESRRVLARWSARMRSVKRRVQDCARQFPTSSLVLVFTKPFRSADNRLKWCVPTRKECSSRATSLRRADA